jgi:IS5 family transposase
LLKQQRQLSYEELAFHLEDSASFRAFARLPLAWSPKKSVLHQTISAIRPETWEAVNQELLASAKWDKLESGATVRIDSTVTAALMHQPSGSALLWDAVRVMTRLLRQAAALPGRRRCSGAIAGALPRSAHERSSTAVVKTTGAGSTAS